jgi:hypothetical protein
MKPSRISLAIAAIGAVASAPVFALPASSYTNAAYPTGEFVGSTENIRISGASAQDNGVLGSALSYCTAGTLHRYAISNNFVFFCTPDIGSGAGQILVRGPNGGAAVNQLAIYKYAVGGSGGGVDPVGLNQTLPFLDLQKIATSPACNLTLTSLVGTTTNTQFNAVSATADFDGTGPFATYVNVACNGASSLLTTGATTYIGLSDVEPEFFTNDTANLFSETAYSLIFGVPVTTNIRNALQAQQILTVGNDSLAQMPSLTQAQITSAFTQAGQTWAGIGVTSGLTDDTIYVARRVNSSGTQKTFEALIAKTPNGQAAFKSCTSFVDGFVIPDSGATGLGAGDASSVCNAGAGAAPLVFGGSGGGDVSNCMNFHNGKNRGAIGEQTGETKPGALGWRFVKVDGNAPIHADVAAGRYPYVVMSSINTRINNNPTASALGYADFVTRLKSDFKNPATIKLINGSDQTFGPSGLMASFPGLPAVPDFTGASAVIPWNKDVGGTTVNNCQPLKAPF